jgi:ribonuclease HI
MALNRRLEVQWKWLRGHNGHAIQSRADSLAYREARTLWRTERLAA